MFASAQNPDILPDLAIQHSVSISMASDAPTIEVQAYLSTLPDIAAVVPRRRAQFLAGRYCAYEAMRRLDPVRSPAVLHRGSDGQPLWPDAVVGSITHTDDFASSAVALKRDAAGIGIDSERVMTSDVASEIASFVAREDEIARIVRTGDLNLREGLTLIFSAKESLFKCLYPLTGVYFDYLDAELQQLDVRTRSFTMRLGVRLDENLQKGALFTGRFEASGGDIHTGILLPHQHRRVRQRV